MKKPDTAYPHGLLLSAPGNQGRFIWQLVGVLDT
jgi:hypothetical protein